MNSANLIKRCVTALVVGLSALGCDCASAAPLPTGVVALTTAAPAEITAVGYIYQDADGAWLDGQLAVGFVAATAVTPFYTPSYYPAYVYAAPPVYYAPLPYDGPAIVYGRPLLAADPYYPAFYPYIRGPRYWPRYRY